MKTTRIFLSIITFLVFAAGCNQAGQLNLDGIITQVELGKDGVQVEMQTEYLHYNVTISKMQTEIVGSFDQIVVGAQIEVSGREIAGMDPPLIVADTVRILGSSNPLTGSTWILTTYNDQQPINDYQPTLKFETNQVSGTTGCNHYGGTYQINDDSITYDGVYSTEMACLEPAGIMDQEQDYLEILRAADRFSLTGEELVVFADGDRYLKFSPYDSSAMSTSSRDRNDTVSVEAPTEISENQVFADLGPPWEYNHYQDAETGIGILIPDSWIVTGIVEGEYAILQSYPEDKYVGGELREEGDTKCDLNIQPLGISSNEVIAQWKSSPMTSILSEEPFALNSGQVGIQFEIDSMGQSISVVTELGGRVVVLTCFGDFSLVDEIAATLNYFE